MRAAVEPDALVVAMTLVPHLYARNRSFALFEDPEVRRARRRAGVLRGIVRQLTGAHGHVEGLHATDEDRAWIDRALRRLASGLRLADPYPP